MALEKISEANSTPIRRDFAFTKGARLNAGLSAMLMSPALTLPDTGELQAPHLDLTAEGLRKPRFKLGRNRFILKMEGRAKMAATSSTAKAAAAQ